MEQYQHHPSYQLLVQGLRKDLRKQLALLGIGTLIWTYCGLSLVASFSWVRLLLFLLGMPLPLLMIKRAQWWQPTQHPLIHRLSQHPDTIVWVYGVQTNFQPFGLKVRDTGLLYFKLENGDDHTVSLPAEKLKQVSLFLNRILPRATFGYQAEHERQYEIDPTQLRRPKP